MKIAIYIRTSTAEQEPENQLEPCRMAAAGLQLGEAEVYEDKQSAWKDNADRPQFERLLDLIKAGQLEHLIVWDLDRIYRNRKRLVGFFEVCKAYGCKVHSFRQAWLEDLNKVPTPWNEIMHGLMLQVMGWLAEEESSKKSERVRLAVKKLPGGPTMSYKGKVWGRKPLSQETILRVVELHKQGLSVRQISLQVSYWDKHGHKKLVARSTVHKIIAEHSSVQAIAE